MTLTPSQRRREREKQEHRRAILEAAELVFAEKGFEATTMEDVARKAEFSVGGLYTFFENKETMCGEVLLHIADEFHSEFHNLLRTAQDPLGTISAVIELRLRSMEKHGKFFRFFLETKRGSKAFPDHAIPRTCLERYEAYIDKLAELWSRAIRAGVVKKMDPLYSALGMEGAINAFSAYWTRRNMKLSITEQMDILRQNLLAVVTVDDRHNVDGKGKRSAK